LYIELVRLSQRFFMLMMLSEIFHDLRFLCFKFVSILEIVD